MHSRTILVCDKNIDLDPEAWATLLCNLLFDRSIYRCLQVSQLPFLQLMFNFFVISSKCLMHGTFKENIKFVMFGSGANPICPKVYMIGPFVLLFLVRGGKGGGGGMNSPPLEKNKFISFPSWTPTPNILYFVDQFIQYYLVL